MEPQKSFKTTEEAQKELDDNRSEYMKWTNHFCPVAKQKCRADCVCWVDPWVSDGSKRYPKHDGFMVVYGYCSSPMVTGEITTNYA